MCLKTNMNEENINQEYRLKDIIIIIIKQKIMLLTK